MRPAQVLVVGAGFSGSLAALHLLASPGGPNVTLAERGGGFGPGLAFGANNGPHLLNVRAGNMSAFPARPTHFIDWLRGEGGQPEADAAGFASRRTFGAYLQQLLREAATAGHSAARLQLVADSVVDLERQEDGRLQATFDMGRTQSFDAVVLALGALPPVGPKVPDPKVLEHPRYVANPWAGGALANVRPKDTVMLLGASLTMVDVVSSLVAAGLQQPMLALSRRGLLPNRHAGAPAAGQAPPRIGERLSQSLRYFRDQVKKGADWRTAFDALRPLTASLWRGMTLVEQQRFLRHLRPYWDVHRHRMAPAVAERVAGMIAAGKLKVGAGRLADLKVDGDGLIAVWRPRGEATTQAARVDWLINCTGQSGSVERTADPLLSALVRRGLLRADPLRLGMEVDDHYQVVGADGAGDHSLTAIGPLTRGAFWETAAVPDLRVQAQALAAHIGAHLQA
jgi:uncharacterized NAD(P)/FAD-binding protein YdhS